MKPSPANKRVSILKELESAPPSQTANVYFKTKACQMRDGNWEQTQWWVALVSNVSTVKKKGISGGLLEKQRIGQDNNDDVLLTFSVNKELKLQEFPLFFKGRRRRDLFPLVKTPPAGLHMTGRRCQCQIIQIQQHSAQWRSWKMKGLSFNCYILSMWIWHVHIQSVFLFIILV